MEILKKKKKEFYVILPIIRIVLVTELFAFEDFSIFNFFI